MNHWHPDRQQVADALVWAMLEMLILACGIATLAILNPSREDAAIIAATPLITAGIALTYLVYTRDTESPNRGGMIFIMVLCAACGVAALTIP